MTQHGKMIGTYGCRMQRRERFLTKAARNFLFILLALEECKNGAGVLIGHDDLVAAHIENVDLIAPFRYEGDYGKEPGNCHHEAIRGRLHFENRNIKTAKYRELCALAFPVCNSGRTLLL